jgi:zinc protease
MQKNIFITPLLALAFTSLAQVKPDSYRAAKSADITIPCEKFQLANGLTVLIHEDHSDPIVYVDVTYHVGSAREQQGRSGFAHFFEHMMFQGSKHVADEQHFKIITDAGGTLNGSTNTDRTNYFETVPAGQLEKMLWLEADRMGFLLDSVTKKKFEVQRGTVKNERGQRYDNAPYGLVGEKIGEALYPQGHPYSWTTIGYIEDLNRVDENDLKRFYMRWYGPNNAVLTVAGNVNTERVMKLVEKYFGPIQRGPEVKPQTVPPVKLTENRYVSYEDNVKFPSLNYAFPTVDLKQKDDAALDVLATILSGSQGSPFYKAFIQSGKAASANSFQYSRELAGQFQFVIRANPNTPLADIEKEVKRVLSEWEKKGVSNDDLAKFKAHYKSGLYDRLSTVQGKGATLASHFTLHGDAGYLKTETERYMAVTKADVMRVYATYIKNKPAVILSCLPKGKGDLRARPDNWKMYARTVEPESAEYKNLQFKEPTDNFDRSVIPEYQAGRPQRPADYYRFTTTNGISCIGIQQNDIPKVNILVSFRAGHRFEPKEKSGLAELTAHLLEKSSVKTKAEEIENKLDRLGSNVTISSGDEDFSISIQSLTENLPATLKIVEESLFEPKFDKDEFENERKQQTDRIAQAQTNAGAMADMAYRKVLYGPEHIMGYPSSGTAETVGALTLSDVQEYYKKVIASAVSIAISGNLDAQQVEKELAFLSRLTPGTEPVVKEPEIPKIEKTRIYFVDKKNAAQSEIRIGYIALPYNALGAFNACNVMNFSFSGSFNSRVNYLLREVKYWTYGVRGGFTGTHFAGPFTISGGFKSNTTDSTLVEIFKEFKKYTENGITADELSFTKNAMIQSDALKYESPMQKLYFGKRMLEYNLDKNFVADQTQFLKDVQAEEIKNAAVRFLPYNNMAVIVVGDKATNFEKLKNLGFEVQEMDLSGKIIN